MESVADAFAEMEERLFETYGIKCPKCHKLLLRPKIFNKKGEKMAGACATPGCGYKEADSKAKERRNENVDLTIKAYKNDAYGYLEKASVTSSLKVFSKSFANYSTGTVNEKRALTYARNISAKLCDETVHALLVGQTGTGKTHLAVGIMLDYLKRNNYMKKAMFIDFPQLMDQLKMGISNDDIGKKVNQCLEEAKKCDLLVLDDLGAERDSDYSLSVVDTIFRARENESIVVTSNLAGNTYEERYGARTFGRLKMHGSGNTFSFNGIDDHRR
ncbi:ATP-binding protein [Liquorilactobacillus satsumensis]|uniref:ATP-binding protein n=1 Tax=Liquorilactobacillus satsumensis TaxID=259059 RepID=UPI00345D965A